MSFTYFYLFILVHPYLAMWWKSFQQADRQSWEALIPVYNYFVAFKIGCKKPWWSLLLVFPGIHLVMWAVANVSYIRRFGYFSLLDTVQGIFFPYIIMAKIASSGDKILPETNWANSKEVSEREWGDHLVLFMSLPIIGHVIALAFSSITRAEPGKKTKVKEWGDSLLFALVAASIIRTYVFEPFRIPTGSMEKTLLIGDFLFVNKLAYGPKVPVTPLSYPLVHNTTPWYPIKSYTTLEKGSYHRLPGYSSLERNDVVVFNYPAGDTAVYDPRMPHGLMGHNYHDLLYKDAWYQYASSSEGSNDNQAIYSALTKRNNKLPDSLKLSANQIQIETNTLLREKFVSEIEEWKSKSRKSFAEGVTYTQDRTGRYFPVEHYGVVPRPVDKRENYIKRCVGVPGDSLEIINSILYVNGKPAFVAENQNLSYTSTKFEPAKIAGEKGEEKYGIIARNGWDMTSETDSTIDAKGKITRKTITSLYCNLESINKVKRDFPKAEFTLDRSPQYSDSTSRKPNGIEMYVNIGTFPNDPHINNTVSDFQKFWIPKKGVKIKLTKENIAWYRRIITAYEGHKLEEKADGIYIDGKKTDSYTFAMNYYWMMGDNRFNSADSRMWGFVPEDHIVGKASLVWLSARDGVRWNRIFKLIK